MEMMRRRSKVLSSSMFGDKDTCVWVRRVVSSKER